MYQLDPVGRLAPSSLDVSRAAAARHHHVSSLRRATASPDHPARGSARRWFRLAAARRSVAPRRV